MEKALPRVPVPSASPSPRPLARTALSFDGSDDYVTFGDNPALKLGTFTLECWFKREAGGTGASTGSGGITGMPLITKGRGQSDGSNVDCNYFFGIDETSGVLVADFEDPGHRPESPDLGVHRRSRRSLAARRRDLRRLDLAPLPQRQAGKRSFHRWTGALQ